MTIIEFIDMVNKLRLSNKNEWYAYNQVVEIDSHNFRISIKGFSFWLQVFEIDGLAQSTTMFIKTAKEFKNQIDTILTNKIKQRTSA